MPRDGNDPRAHSFGATRHSREAERLPTTDLMRHKLFRTGDDEA